MYLEQYFGLNNRLLEGRSQSRQDINGDFLNLAGALLEHFL